MEEISDKNQDNYLKHDLFTPAVRYRMQLFCFESLDFIYKLQFPDP